MTKEGTLYSEDRGCTDIVFLLLFALFWVGMIFVAAVAFANGHTDRLTHGIDYEGNLCGVSNQPKQPSDAVLQNPGVALHGSVWTDRKYLWFPVTQDMSIEVIRKLGICVNHCPAMNSSHVVSYTNTSQAWPVFYTSKPFFGRCLPIISESAGWENIKELAPAIKVGEWFFDVFDYLVASKWTLLACVGTAVALCFIWSFLLRWIITPLVYLSLLLVLGLLTAGAYGMWTYGVSLAGDESSPYHEYAKWWKIGAVVMAVIALLYICLVVFLCKRINTAIDIIQLASKVINSVPSLWIVPIFFFVLMILLAVWCIGIGALITTSDKLGTETVDIPAIPDVPGREIGQQVEVTFLQNSRSPMYMELYYVFGFLWTSGFFSAFAFMIISFCGVFWYFSIPGDNKYSPTGAVLKATWWTLRYHVGTLAFGSLVVAVIQFIRFLIQKFEKQIKAGSEGAGCGKAASFCICCCQCCLACFERLVKFINKNAYIITCIQGANFCSACAEAIRLLVSNVLRVGAVNFISDWVMIFMKALITLSNVGIGWLFLHHVNALKPTDEINDFAPLIFIGFFTYIIASIFMHIFATLIDTILLCFCYDEDVNNGSDRPYYMTTDLQDLINKHNQTSAITQAARQQTSYST